MKVLGVRFAPLMVPMERRWQTLGVLCYSSLFLFAGFAATSLIIFILFTNYYYLSLIYLTWLYYDRNISNEGGRTVEWVRRWNIWRHCANYFPVKLVKTAELDPNRNYILGYHPHGIMAVGAFCNFNTEATDFSNVYPGIKPHLLTLQGQFTFPLHRELVLSSGSATASKESIDWFLTKGGLGQALIIVIGGAEEALNARSSDECHLIINRRKGFVKLALKHGAPLVPIFSFGENDLFDQLSNPQGSLLRRAQNKLTKVFGFSPPFMHGRGIFNYSFGYLPYRKPIVTVIGKPMEVQKTANPSPELVDEVHQQYLKELKNIFDTYKQKYGNPNQELVFT